MGKPTAIATTPVYEAEPSQRQVLGSVNINACTWWTGTLTMPEGGSGVAFLELTRHGPASRTDDAIHAVVLLAELPAIRVLVHHLTASAER
jgi:hypothetical protein